MVDPPSILKQTTVKFTTELETEKTVKLAKSVSLIDDAQNVIEKLTAGS